MATTAVLDQGCKMELTNFCFPRIYPEPEAFTNITFVLNVLHELYEVHVEAHNSSLLQQSAQETACSSSGSSTSATVLKVSTGRAIFLSHVKSVDSVRSIETDLDIYHEEGVYIGEKDANGINIDTEFEALAR